MTLPTDIDLLPPPVIELEVVDPRSVPFDQPDAIVRFLSRPQVDVFSHVILTPRTMKFGHKDYFYTKKWHKIHVL